jgi:hydroxymethylbilane synthase
MTTHERIRLGTRASTLARWQANFVAGELRATGIDVEIIPISTEGDRQQVGPIGDIGAQGVFTKEIQRALLEDRIDLAVHSLKDLPTDPVKGLMLAAVPKRGPVGDALLSREGFLFDELPEGAVIGTGSLRRQAQLRSARTSLRTRDIRGNVDTRLAKLKAGEYDAIVLAEAGLMRLGLADQITEVLPTKIMLSAVGQGALGLETRSDDPVTHEALRGINHCESHQAVLAERALLAALRGGCMAPVAGWAHFKDDTEGNDDGNDDGELHLHAVVLSADGGERIDFSLSGDPGDPARLGEEVAEELLANGAGELIEAARQSK